MTAMKRVAIVQRRLTHYRVPLFELLRTELAAIDIHLDLLVGQGKPDEEAKHDSATLPWAVQLPTRYFLGGRLCWQPFRDYLHDADLVVVTQENALLANHLMLLLPRKLKFAFWGHGANLQSDNPDGCKERFKRWTTTQADWWFAYTRLSADLVKAAGFPGDRITVLDNAVDTSALRRQMASITAAETAALRQSLGFGSGPVGIFMGSLYPEKRLDFLFEAADRLRRHDPRFQLLIVGDGPLRDVVRNYCVDRPWCAAVGAKTGRDKALHLALAEVMLNPGLVGLGILDAFAAGVPIVTTDCGLHSPEIAYLSQDQNGLMTANTLDAFVAGVRRILDDDEYRARLADGGRQAASRYTLENMVKNFTSGIESALQSHMDDFFSGRKLYGNDFGQEEIDAWFLDEAEGYFNLVQASTEKYSYGYHALNERHGFSRLPERRFSHVLGVGSAYGEELAPILGRSDRISILEPSEGFGQKAIRGVPVSYVKPNSTGIMPFSDDEFDLITCFGVLHHIPNVGKVIDEYFRVLKPGGYALVREPIISMGDWRRPRKGLTKHERGIPLEILQSMVRTAGFEILNEQKCMFSLTSRLHYVMSRPVYNSPLAVVIDRFLSTLPVWSRAYHARNVWQKFRPSAVFLVLRKSTDRSTKVP